MPIFNAQTVLAMGALMLSSTALAAPAAPVAPVVAEKSGAPAAPTPPKKAYLVVTGNVFDRKAFAEGYAVKLPPIYAKYGGKYLAAGRDPIVEEGKAGFSSYVISEWPSVAAARAFWDSPEYAPLKQARIDKKWGEFNVWIFEGMAVPGVVGSMALDAGMKQAPK